MVKDRGGDARGTRFYAFSFKTRELSDRDCISEDYKNRPHFVQFTKTALLAYLRLGQVVTKNALRLLNSPNYLV